MSLNEKKINEENKNKNNKDNETTNNEPNNLFFDLYDDDTMNISLEEEKPLFTKLYSSVNEKIITSRNEIENDDNNEFLASFENLFKNQIDIINLCAKNNEPNFIYAANVLIAKIKIFNFFNTKYLKNYLNRSDSESSKTLSLINDNLFKTINKIVDIIFKLGKKSNTLNNEVMEIQNKNGLNDIYIKQLEDENKLINEKYIKLKEENELMTKKLINNNYINHNIIYNKNNHNIKLKSKKNNINSNTFKEKSQNKLNNKNKNNNSTDKKQNINNNNSLKDPNRPNHNNINNNVSLTNLSPAGNRVFTLKMMKEIISNIYSSKNAFDKKSLQNRQPKQTMEEFMYTFLNQKYGLKNMVIEWATNIINGIRTFSNEDTEISLFGKILQNELEESCQLLISNLKDNINSIIINILRNEYPYKNDIEINKMKKQYIKNEIPPEKTQQIIEALFDEKGKEILFEKINKEINNRKDIIMKNKTINGKLTREEYNKIIADKENESNSIQYDFLVDICLEYQIKLHIKYLKPFIKLFKNFDTDRDGVLNEEQFVDLIKNMNIFGDDNIDQVIEEFLNNIDPFQNKHIIFSDIVELFSKMNYDKNQTIMDKFCIKDNNNNNINYDNNQNIIKNDNNQNIIKNENDNNNDNENINKIKKLNEDIII